MFGSYRSCSSRTAPFSPASRTALSFPVVLRTSAAPTSELKTQIAVVQEHLDQGAAVRVHDAERCLGDPHACGRGQGALGHAHGRAA